MSVAAYVVSEIEESGIAAGLEHPIWPGHLLDYFLLQRGCAIGPVIALISVVLSQLFGTQDLPLFMGFSRIGVGAGNLLGVPLVGLSALK